MSLVKISRIDLSLFVDDVIAFIHAFLSLADWQTAYRYTSKLNQLQRFVTHSLILSLSLSFVRIRGDSSPYSRLISNGGSDRDFESTAFFVHDAMVHLLTC